MTDKDDVQHVFMTVKAIRGREAAIKTKWQSQGWEFVDQTHGTLRSDLTFRRVKPKGFGALLAQGFAAFRGLEPRTQKALLSGVVALLALLVIGGAALATLGEEESPIASASPSDPSDAPPAPQSTQKEESEEPEASDAEPYAYDGPEYEIVIVDENQGPAGLSQYWVHTTAPFDFSSNAYKSQVKQMITDIAHQHGTADFIAQVVTDREIAEAESPSTYQDFLAEHGEDYATNTIPKLEEEGWVASYTGGFDSETGGASVEASAYEVIWRPYATGDVEKWQPQVPVS